MRGKQVGIFVASLGILLIGSTAHAALNGMQRLATGLNFPTYGTFAPGDKDHLFITEKTGTIKVLDLKTNTVNANSFLFVSDTDAANEGGLMGMTFHPGYNDPTSSGYHKFYVYVTVDNGGATVPGNPSSASPFSTHIREYTVDPNNPYSAPAASKIEIMSWARPGDNHVSGWIGFSPKDKFLYVSSGDGGGSDDNDAGHSGNLGQFPNNDAPGNAQDLTNNLMGKFLRIDVDHDDFNDVARELDTKNYSVPTSNPFFNTGNSVNPEIWAYGLRNPFRDSFDRDTGDLWIGDVGQGAREEIDFQPATGPGSEGGVNYGWRLREGKIANPLAGVGGTLAGATDPIYDYTHGTAALQGFAEIGGYVYRGPDPSLQGKYFFTDEVSHHVWMLTPGVTPTVVNIDTSLVPNAGALNAPSSFIEDAVGNLYLIDYSSTSSSPPGGQGEVYRILTSQVLPGDYNADGYVDAADYTIWRDTYGQAGSGLPADGDGNLSIGDNDYTVWLNNFGTTVHTLSPGGGGGGGGNVPEPATIVLAFPFLAAVIKIARKARRKSAAAV